MNAQPATQETIQTTPSKCTSGTDWPCEFCVSLRAKHAERRSEIEKQLAEDFLRSYSQNKRAGGRLGKMTSDNSFIRLRGGEETIYSPNERAA